MRRVLLCGVLLAGCGRLEFAPLSDAVAATDATDGRSGEFVCGEWTSVMRVPGTEGVTSNTRSSAVAPDGLSIVWVDDVGGGIAYYQTRPARDQAFGSPTPVPGIPSGIWDVAVLDGGRTLVYATNFAVQCPLAIMAAQPYQFTGGAVELSSGCSVGLLGAYLTTNGLSVYATDMMENGRVARRGSTSDSFSTFTEIMEFPDPMNYPAVRDDELELYFENGAGGSTDLWVVKRSSTADPWGTPELVALVNSPTVDEDVSITADGRELYFDSNRNGPAQLFVATRTCN